MTEAYYVPDAAVRLFSPPKYIQANPGSSFHMTSNSSEFHFSSKSRLTFRTLSTAEIGLPIRVCNIKIEDQKSSIVYVWGGCDPRC